MGQITSYSHPSALSAPGILAIDLQNLQQHNRLTKIGRQSTHRFISSPLGLVLNSDGGWRRIHNLSYLRGKSVNNEVSEAFKVFKFDSLDDAITALLSIKTDTVMVD